MSQSSSPPPTLLTLPRELLSQILSYLIHPTPILSTFYNEGTRTLQTFNLGFFSTHSIIHTEARHLFRLHNTFITISTPFAEAEHWVSIHGSVPIVRTLSSNCQHPDTRARRHAARRFPPANLDVTIDSPRFPTANTKHAKQFVVLVQDLPMFTKHWFYTDVTNTGQNAHLRLTLEIKNPFAAPGAEDEMLPKRVQKKLMEPFGVVKGLDEFVVRGPHLQSVVDGVRKEMAVKAPTPRECLEECTRLKDEGNEAFKAEKWDEAMKLYMDAFEAMFIICRGRERSVWGDSYFQEQIFGGKYDGEFAGQTRIMLRLVLVSNVVATYLKMGEYDEARFWGMRTIDLFRGSMGTGAEEDPILTGFNGIDALGKIYFRTGLAFKELGDKSEARKLLNVALKYRPNDKIVKKELESLTLKLG